MDLFETVLLPEEIERRVAVCCLACRRCLGRIGYADAPEPGADVESSLRPVSLSLLSRAAQLARTQGAEVIRLRCRCGQQSAFHLL